MNKRAAIEIVSRRRTTGLLRGSLHFANVNSRKAVWWLDLPRSEVFDLTTPVVDLVLAETDTEVHHLRVPKNWLVANIGSLAIRQAKDVISLELSTLSHQRFRDVRPRSGRLNFAPFLVK
jgi:hypothetical protein